MYFAVFQTRKKRDVQFPILDSKYIYFVQRKWWKCFKVVMHYCHCLFLCIVVFGITIPNNTQLLHLPGRLFTATVIHLLPIFTSPSCTIPKLPSPRIVSLSRKFSHWISHANGSVVPARTFSYSPRGKTSAVSLVGRW